jgi:hypothetical protein
LLACSRVLEIARAAGMFRRPATLVVGRLNINLAERSSGFHVQLLGSARRFFS